MTTQTPEPMFQRANYGPTDTADRAKQTIAHFAPPGSKIHLVLRLTTAGLIRMRMYVVAPFHNPKQHELVRIDGQMPEELFNEIIAKQAYDKELISYYGFDRTDGTDHSGFGWDPKKTRSNVAWGILYALADIVHGNRSAWTPNHL